MRTLRAKGEAGEKVSFMASIQKIKVLLRHCEEHLRRSNPDCLRGWITGLLRFARNDGVAAVMIAAYAAEISLRRSPRPPVAGVMRSPPLRKVGGFMPRPTPGGVPVVMMSPGSSVM